LRLVFNNRIYKPLYNTPISSSNVWAQGGETLRACFWIFILDAFPPPTVSRLPISFLSFSLFFPGLSLRVAEKSSFQPRQRKSADPSGLS
jgi:hypothetical protein